VEIELYVPLDFLHRYTPGILETLNVAMLARGFFAHAAR
jgi:hypothetical protein